MTEEMLRTLKNLLSSGKGDSKRLREMIETIKKGEPVVMSDYKYVQTLIEESSKVMDEDHPTITSPKTRESSLELLRVRLAEGQITIEEYRELKKALTED
jgi:hypothetical protein